jgi:hypothetical protein
MKPRRFLCSMAAISAAFLMAACGTTSVTKVEVEPPHQVCVNDGARLEFFMDMIRKHNPGIREEVLTGDDAKVFIFSLNRTGNPTAYKGTKIILLSVAHSPLIGIVIIDRQCVTAFYPNAHPRLVEAWRSGIVPRGRSTPLRSPELREASPLLAI